MVAKERQCSHRSTITPNKTCSADFYRRIKRRVGRSLKGTHCKRALVTTRKQTAYKLSGTKSSLSSFERVPRPLCRQDSTCGNRQHYSSVLHKQGSTHEVGPTLWPTMENLDLVYQEATNAQSPTHSRPTECGSRQAIQTRPDHSNRVVSSRGLPSLYAAGGTSLKPTYLPQGSTTSYLCLVTGSGSPSYSSGYTQSAMGGSGRVCLSTSSHLGQSGGEVAGHPMQENHSDCSGVAQYALVLGSNGHFQPNPTEPALSAQPVDTALQSDPSQISDNLNLHAWLVEPQQSKSRASLRQLAAKIKAPQRRSTRSG